MRRRPLRRANRLGHTTLTEGERFLFYCAGQIISVMIDSEESDEGLRVHGSWELKVQIVLLAVVAAVLGSVGFIIFPLIFNEKDPVMSLVFAFLLAIVCMFLGGSVVWGYYKVRVGAEAREYAQDMAEKAMQESMEFALSEEKRRYGELLEREKEALAERLEAEKKVYMGQLRQEFERRLDEEERNFADAHRDEYDRKLGQDQQEYVDKLRAEFEAKLEAERQRRFDAAQGEFEKERAKESDALVERARREFEERLKKERKEYDERARADYEVRIQKEKEELAERLRQDIQIRAEREKQEYIERVNAEFQRRLEGEKKAHEEAVRSEFERQAHDERDAYVEKVRADYDGRLEAERKSYMDSLRDDFEGWKREFAESFRKEMRRETQTKAEAEAKPAAATPQKAPVEDIFGPQPKAEAESKPVDFSGMSAEEMLGSSVDLLQSGTYGAKVTFTNAKTRKKFTLLRKANREIILEAPVENISIRARLLLRDFCAQNKLNMEKTDDFVKISFPQDREEAVRNLREAVQISFAEPLKTLELEVRADRN
jgi:hypothetical protein